MPGPGGRNGHHAELSSTGLDAAIAAAASIYGNVTRQQLLGLGVSGGGIRHRIAIGRLHRVYRAVYAVGHRAAVPLERADAAVLACGRGAALSHASAMTLWGYWRRWDEPFEVAVARDRRTPGITVHRSSALHRRDIRMQLGIRVTSPARTLFDIVRV